MSNCFEHIIKIHNRILSTCITELVIQITKLVGELELLLVCLKLRLGVVSPPWQRGSSNCPNPLSTHQKQSFMQSRTVSYGISCGNLRTVSLSILLSASCCWQGNHLCFEGCRTSLLGILPEYVCLNPWLVKQLCV